MTATTYTIRALYYHHRATSFRGKDLAALTRQAKKEAPGELDLAIDEARALAAISREPYDVVNRDGWKIVRSCGSAQVGDWTVRPDGQAWRYVS